MSKHLYLWVSLQLIVDQIEKNTNAVFTISGIGNILADDTGRISHPLHTNFYGESLTS
jgi:hypothetical protein